MCSRTQAFAKLDVPGKENCVFKIFLRNVCKEINVELKELYI